MLKEQSFYHIRLSDNIQYNKLIGVTDGMGNKTTITYQRIDVSQGANVSSPYNEEDDGGAMTGNGIKRVFPIGLEVVKKISAASVNNEYLFKDPKIHRQARGFLGFAKIQVTDSIHLIDQLTEMNYHPAYFLLYPYKSTIKTTGGALISENYQTYTFSSPGSKRYFMRQDSLVSKDFLQGITVKTTFTNYDSHRNPQTIKTDYGNGTVSTEALTYVAIASQFLNRIASRQITRQATGQTNVVRKEYFFYDSKGNPSYHVKDSTDVNKVQTLYENYDKYGNPGIITVTANGVSRSQSMTYCSYGRFLKKVTDLQLNQSATYTYNELRGLVATKVDRIGTTTYQYDGFGRLKLTTYPGGTKTANALQWAGTISGKPTNAKYYAYAETSGQPPVWVWYDKQGREIRKDSYGLNNKKIFVDTEYNAKGQVDRVSEPYFSGATKTYITYKYDRLGRDSTVVTPMGTTTYTYSGLTVSTTSPAGTAKTTLNPAGWVVETETNGKKVNFTHYASGLVRSATPEGGAAITMEYDLQGNRTKLTDPDAGVITSKYDGWGQLTWQKQAIHTSALITTDYVYLPSGLLQSKVCNGETTTYGYDSQYRPNRVSIAGKHGQGFVYDKYDRITQSSDTVEGKVFVHKTEYDLLGRVFKEIYPSGYTLIHQYDKYSYPTGVIDTQGTNIWQALESNAKGQLTKTQKGSKETVSKFDSRGFPVSVVTSGIDNYSYVFDSQGNLVSRKDGIANYKDSLTYDAMNRLTAWNVYQGSTLQQTNSMTYNATTGNIQTKSDLGNFNLTYGENGKPHALTSISGEPAQFPANNLAVTYTDFKKIKTLTEGNKTYSLTYGVDGQRRKSEYKVNNTTQETRYYLGNYEEITDSVGNTKKIHYLSGGAILITAGNVSTLYYGYYDHLGSLTTLTNASGAVVERYAYDPWGNRRNPANWTLADSRTSWMVNRGFTMHEHLDAFGIINMNGRVYDPLTAQFFSPDPYVQAPGNWLNYNRYSYGFNNPMSYIDPSGEIAWFIPIIIGAVIGGTSGALIGHANGATGWNMVGYVAGGAVIGGLSGGAAAGVSALGGGAALAGMAAGGLGGAGFSGLATGWNGQAMLKGAAFGAISGFVGGGIASAIGGGWGALAGGATSNLTSQLLYNGGDFSNVNWLSVGISGAASFGLYHGMQYLQFRISESKLNGMGIKTYEQFSKVNTAYQRSRFWRREFGVYLNEDGSAKLTPWRDTRKFSVNFRSSQGSINKTMHGHWAKANQEWVELPNSRFQRYNGDPNSYPDGSHLTETVGGYHSPGDMAGLPGTSFVVGRVSSSYLTNSMSGWNYIYPDPFVRFFLFPFLSLK